MPLLTSTLSAGAKPASDLAPSQMSLWSVWERSKYLSLNSSILPSANPLLEVGEVGLLSMIVAAIFKRLALLAAKMRRLWSIRRVDSFRANLRPLRRAWSLHSAFAQQQLMFFLCRKVVAQVFEAFSSLFSVLSCWFGVGRVGVVSGMGCFGVFLYPKLPVGRPVERDRNRCSGGLAIVTSRFWLMLAARR
mmetsp:Transcript_28459/g.73595  ORF Transcript_28459/g.73595 Transcript_28459/m.73595 type:complete len:191 (+) Transcript_28459:2537-3109(+)